MAEQTMSRLAEQDQQRDARKRLATIDRALANPSWPNREYLESERRRLNAILLG
jgi:hypothetical protein